MYAIQMQISGRVLYSLAETLNSKTHFQSGASNILFLLEIIQAQLVIKDGDQQTVTLIRKP